MSQENLSKAQIHWRLEIPDLEVRGIILSGLEMFALVEKEIIISKKRGPTLAGIRLSLLMSKTYIRAASRENPRFAYAKTKTQISFAGTAKLISAFVFAIRIVQSLYYLNPKFKASSHLLWLNSPVCCGPGRKPRRPVFSQHGSYIFSLSSQMSSSIGSEIRPEISN